MPIGGIFISVFNPVNLLQLAMGPAGWASLAERTIGSQIAMNLIQRLGQQLGLPQPVIDLAQAAFANASGQPGLMRQNIREAVQGFVNQFDLRPSEAGQLQRELMSASDKSMSNLMEIAGKYRRKGGSDEDEETGGSWLVALARAMGKVMDAKAAQIKEKSDSIASLANQPVTKDRTGLSAASQQNQNKLSSETTLLQAYTQELTFISNAATNSIKTIGESLTTNARK